MHTDERIKTPTALQSELPPDAPSATQNSTDVAPTDFFQDASSATQDSATAFSSALPSEWQQDSFSDLPPVALSEVDEILAELDAEASGKIKSKSKDKSKRRSRAARARRRKAKRRRARRAAVAVLLGLLVLLLSLLLFSNRESIASKVKSLFDFRPNLTEVSAFETITTQEVESITAWVQSVDYPACTELKTITDSAEIAQIIKSIKNSKLILSEGVTIEDIAEAEAAQKDISSKTDSYRFAFADQTITVYTKQSDANFLYIANKWQEIEPVEQPNLYGCYLASTAERTLYDANGLVYYPQVWQSTATEQAAPSYGIDVSYHQGVIDWAQVAQDGVDFAIIRVGVRYAVSGNIAEDILARYNLQEATKHGIAVGVYFFSTATTEAEVLEEAQMTLDIMSGYPITYPVVYDCEMFHYAENRNGSLTAAERSNLAEVYLEAIEAEGYTGMFYGSKNDLDANAQWETNYLQSKYRIWVAQYPGDENAATPQGTSSYVGRHEMWQYTASATVAGIGGTVDRNIAYFSYSEQEKSPKGTPAAEVAPDYDALAKMEETHDQVTAKERVNVRSSMDSSNDSNLIGSILNGEVVTRIGIGGNGWSKIEFEGGVGYVMTGLITTNIKTPDPAVKDDGFETEFEAVNQNVTAKELVNLRNMPSVTDAASVVVASIAHGEVITRTGVSDEGFSRVEYQGETLYCVSSYLEVVG